MNKKLVIILALAGVLVLSLGIVIAASAVSGAAFTTFNAHVDGSSKDVCKNSAINCNIYGAKEYVWLNGGPTANGLGPDGQYFFAVLVPGGQPDPNDGGAKNLSDDFDAYTNRTFTVTDGEVSAYTGTHWLDDGVSGPAPNGLPPYIRLFPYADTTNPGGVYILAICSLEDGYPVEPRDCKYDAFKVKEGRVDYDFMLMGWTFKDRLPNGPSAGDSGLGYWDISITGTGFGGEPINEVVSTNMYGYWEFGKSYNFNRNDPVQNAVLTVCEIPIWDWYQTYPVDDGCYEVTLEPANMAFQGGLDFGNWYIFVPRQ